MSNLKDLEKIDSENGLTDGKNIDIIGSVEAICALDEFIVLESGRIF